MRTAGRVVQYAQAITTTCSGKRSHNPVGENCVKSSGFNAMWTLAGKTATDNAISPPGFDSFRLQIPLHSNEIKHLAA